MVHRGPHYERTPKRQPTFCPFSTVVKRHAHRSVTDRIQRHRLVYYPFDYTISKNANILIVYSALNQLPQFVEKRVVLGLWAKIAARCEPLTEEDERIWELKRHLSQALGCLIRSCMVYYVFVIKEPFVVAVRNFVLFKLLSLVQTYLFAAVMESWYILGTRGI